MNPKLTASLLALVLVLTLTACGGSSTDAPNGTDAVTSSTKDSPETQAPTEPSFPETVLVDNETCTFAITAIDEDALLGYSLKAAIENKTDKELMFSLENVSVNGFMCDPYWAATVTGGMKANDEITFLSSSLEENGITRITDITFTLRVYDANDYTAGDLVSQTFTIHPMGEDAVESAQRVPSPNEIVLFENDDAGMIVTGVRDDSLFGYTLTVYLENRTDKDLMFSASDVAVNGYMCDPFWAFEVASGKRANTTISWFAEDLAENGITEIETVTMPITVYDADDWMADNLIDETFTFSPNF